MKVKLSKCPHCMTYAPPEWTQRSPDGLSKCSQCGAESPNPAWIVFHEQRAISADSVQELVNSYHAEGRNLVRELMRERDELKVERDFFKRVCFEHEAVLEKIADPRKRDHKEPDSYTQLGCVMHMAEEALRGPMVSPTDQQAGPNEPQGIVNCATDRPLESALEGKYFQVRTERDAYRAALADILDGKYRYYAQYEGVVEIPDYMTFIERIFAQYDKSGGGES